MGVLLVVDMFLRNLYSMQGYISTLLVFLYFMTRFFSLDIYMFLPFFMIFLQITFLKYIFHIFLVLLSFLSDHYESSSEN